MENPTIEHRVGEIRHNSGILGGFTYTLKSITWSNVEALCEPWGNACLNNKSQIVTLPHSLWLKFALLTKGTGVIIQDTLKQVSTVLTD